MKYVDISFFKNWNENMAYILGYIVADGCIIKRKGRQNSYVLNITSKDKRHLYKIKRVLKSQHSISVKFNSRGQRSFQLQIANSKICRDLIDLGIPPRKTYSSINLEVPKEYFADFVRGFFDGDGTVYIYKVNGTPQIKVALTSSNYRFLRILNTRLCEILRVPVKKVYQVPCRNYDEHVRKTKVYKVHYYVEDCEKIAELFYSKNPDLYLERKRRVFEKWKNIQRRSYRKQDYPSKIGWRLNKKKQIGAVSSVG